MTIEGFVASHAKNATFEPGLRSFYEYRDLGIRSATEGRVDAHVIRAAAGKEFSSQPHRHKTSFQLIYILKGWFVAGKKIDRLCASAQTVGKSQATVQMSAPAQTQQEPSMKQPNPSSKTLHAPPPPHNPKDYPMHGQTEATPGRDQVREATHSTRSPRESKRPIERTARTG